MEPVPLPPPEIATTQPPPELSFWEAYRILGLCYEQAVASQEKRSVEPEHELPQISKSPESTECLSLPRQESGVGQKTSSGILRQQTSQLSMDVETDESIAKLQGHRLQQVLEPIVAEFPELQELHAIRDASKLPRTAEDISLSTRLCWRFKAHAPPRRRSLDTVCSSKPMLQLSDQLSYRYRQYLLSPMGRTRLAWDFLAVLFICTEMITMPLRTFDASLRRVELSVGLLMFWQLDILMRFISSFYKDGKLVQNHRTILFSYARGWLTFDVTFVLIDWLVLLDLFLEKDALYFAQCGLRLVRLARLNSLTEPMMLRLTEQAVIAVAKIAQISMQVLLVRHLMASAWFHIGRLDAEHGWVAKADLSMTSVWYKYTTSLHWMYCQLGFGGTEIEPGTTAERVFGIVVALEGLAIFSTLLVTITTHTTLLTKSAEERRHKFQKLGQFLSSLHVEPELVLRITCFLQHAFAVKEREVLDEEVPLLELLSKPLRSELQCARFEHHLRGLSFVTCTNRLAESSRRLATGMQQRILAMSDTVFEAGTMASQVYFPCNGSLAYKLAGSDFDAKDAFIVAEMGLWTPWLHLGELSTIEVSTMVVLQIDQFCECLHRSWDNYQAAQSFAHRYVRVMTKLVAVTDLWRFDLAGEDCEDCDGQCPEDAATRSRGFRAHSKSSSGSGLSGLSQFWKRKASPVPASFSQVKPAPMLQ